MNFQRKDSFECISNWIPKKNTGHHLGRIFLSTELHCSSMWELNDRCPLLQQLKSYLDSIFSSSPVSVTTCPIHIHHSLFLFLHSKLSFFAPNFTFSNSIPSSFILSFSTSLIPSLLFIVIVSFLHSLRERILGGLYNSCLLIAYGFPAYLRDCEVSFIFMCLYLRDHEEELSQLYSSLFS